jgi:uncharacterized protein (TIGR00369 family)
MPDAPADLADALNAHRSGWDEVLGLRYVHATRDEIVAEYVIDPRHHQPYGVVHGGVHCSVVESVCSAGAGLDGMAHGLSVVGVENHTSFVHAVRAGRIRVTATPLTRGRRSQLWEATARDDTGRLVATGRVRLVCLEAGSDLAGRAVGRWPGDAAK